MAFIGEHPIVSCVMLFILCSTVYSTITETVKLVKGLK
jgi:hypothetical protein